MADEELPMKRMSIVALWTLAALIGGMAAQWLVGPGTAFAQAIGNPKWVRAVTVYLVDPDREEIRGAVTLDKSRAATIELNDGKERPRLKLRVDAAGSSQAALTDKSGRPCAAVSVEADGTATIQLSDAGNDAGITLTMKDGPQVVLQDSAGQIRGRMAMTKRGDAVLELLDASGKVIWKAPPDEEPTDQPAAAP